MEEEQEQNNKISSNIYDYYINEINGIYPDYANFLNREDALSDIFTITSLEETVVGDIPRRSSDFEEPIFHENSSLLYEFVGYSLSANDKNGLYFVYPNTTVEEICEKISANPELSSSLEYDSYIDINENIIGYTNIKLYAQYNIKTYDITVKYYDTQFSAHLGEASATLSAGSYEISNINWNPRFEIENDFELIDENGKVIIPLDTFNDEYGTTYALSDTINIPNVTLLIQNFKDETAAYELTGLELTKNYIISDFNDESEPKLESLSAAAIDSLNNGSWAGILQVDRPSYRVGMKIIDDTSATNNEQEQQ